MLFTEPTFLFAFLPVLLALYYLPGWLKPAPTTDGRGGRLQPALVYANWLLVLATLR